MSRWYWLTAVGVVVVAAAWYVVSGPGGEDLATDAPTGPLALYNGEWNRDDGMMGGTIAFDGPCFYAENRSNAGTVRTLIALANSGTRWDEEEQTLRVPWGTFQAGDAIEVGGGEAFDDLSLYDWAVPPDLSCDTTRVWIAGRPDD